MSDDVERLEEGLRWARYGCGDWEVVRVVNVSSVPGSPWPVLRRIGDDNFWDAEAFQIGPRIQPPQGD